MLLIDFTVGFSVLSIVFTNLSSMSYKANLQYLDNYSLESGIPVVVLVLALLTQLAADGLLVWGFWWPTARRMACLIDLPSAIVGACVAITKKSLNANDIAFFNLQILAASLFLLLMAI